MNLKQILFTVAISAVSAVGSVGLYNKYVKHENTTVGVVQDGKLPANYAGFYDGKINGPSETIDLTKAANASVPAVVHIKTKIPAKKLSNNLGNSRRQSLGFGDDLFEQFFGQGMMRPNIIPEQRASGSGVIISEDGYIVTNNHVVTAEGGGSIADEITVTLHNGKSYKAKVIGRDPSSDLAVLKIDASNLPFLVYGNSDSIQLGQWVLAIGYPLTLETTVTAGIISATGRSIDINRRQSRGDTPVESFIQTDAAVNQGNSGGALVNANGQLIGINSAILAPTGTYAGYSFAIPVNIIKKIVDDIIKFGDVQRGYLGITYNTGQGAADDDKAVDNKVVGGVVVAAVSPDGGAASAGIKKGDIITKVNGATIVTGIQMSAQIASFRPGDKVPVTYLRNGKEYTVNVVLKKKTDVVTAVNSSARLGGELATLDKSKATKYGLSGGVVVNKVTDGGALSRSRILPGFIITSIVAGEDEVEVNSLEDLNNALQNAAGTVRVRGVYPGDEDTYTYPIRLQD